MTKFFSVFVVSTILMAIPAAFADAPPATTHSTEPAAASPLMRPEAAPGMIVFVRSLLRQMDDIERTTGELTMNDAARATVARSFAGFKLDMQALLADLEAGHMPTMARAQAIGGEIKKLEDEISAAMGPEQSALLRDKLRSLRGLGRNRLVQFRALVDRLNLTGAAQENADKALATAAAAIDQLPTTVPTTQEMSEGNDQVNMIIANAYHQIAPTLTAEQRGSLDPIFAKLDHPATAPTTR